jgi:chromosome segregation ATPase
LLYAGLKRVAAYCLNVVLRVKSLQDKVDALAAQCREAESRCEQAETALAAAEQGSSSATTRLEGELQRNAQLLVMAQNDVAELRTTKLELETELVRSTLCSNHRSVAARG